VILGLDMISDMGLSGGQAGSLSIFSMIESLGTLVGFSWENSFEGGVEVIAKLTADPVIAELGLAVIVTVIVIVPWRRFILTQVLKKEKEWDERHRQKEEAEAVERAKSPAGANQKGMYRQMPQVPTA